MSNRQDQLIVVTGGTKGIGRAIIHKFASEGFSIATCSRKSDDLEALKVEVEVASPGTVHTFVADVSQPDQVANFVSFVKNIACPVEVLVNNAGRFAPGQVHDAPLGALEEQIATNLYSTHYVTSGLVPLMKQQRRGHIFNMCSIASLVAYKGGGLYSVSKFAMYGYSKSLREEMKEFGVRVTSVMPGATLTASWEGVDLPEERLMKAEDVADMIWATYQISQRSVVEDLLIRPLLGDI